MTTLEPPQGVTATEVSVQGIRTRLFEVDLRNDAVPLVLLHGAGVDSALVSYGSVLRALGSRRRVIAPDLPGYGATDFPDTAPFSIPWYADWVRDLLDVLALPQVDLGGLSLGGWITLEFGLRHGDRARRLVPINPGGVTRSFPYEGIVAWLTGHPELYAWMYRANARCGKTMARWQLQWNGVENAAVLTDDLLDAVIANGRARHAGRAFATTQRWALLGEPELACVLDRLAGVTNRTLVIAGRQDKVVPVADSIAAAGLLPHGRVEVLEPCGHWLVRDRPEDFISLVDAFLEAGT